MIYRWTRELHLYLGLCLSPFVLLFAVSVFYMNHAKLAADPPAVERHDRLEIPAGFDRVTGREAVELARRLLPPLGLSGEIGFFRYRAEEQRVTFPVTRPGLEATVEVDLAGRTASVTRRRTSPWESLIYLHKMPGPHNAAIRGNWRGTRLWGWMADTTVALLLFLSISGVYLWWAIRGERRTGLLLLGCGAVTLLGAVYVVIG